MYDDKEDETFFKAWLRAHYAETIRDRVPGSENLDFDIIGVSFHKWVHENKEKLNLNKSEDYEHFIDMFGKFTDIYLKIRDAENTFSEETKYVFYNAKVVFTQQILMLLAPINYEDSWETIIEKINLVAKFIDYWILSRVTRYKSMDYDAAKQAVFKYAKELRHLSVLELKTKLNEYVIDLKYNPDAEIPNYGLNRQAKKYIKHILARVTSYIEEQTGSVSNYTRYMVDHTSNPFEIEHIITDHFEWFGDEYSDENDFKLWRNKIGSLLLLQKSINASLNDKRYEEKLPKYCSATQGNIYSATLGDITYENNPQFCRFNEKNQIGFEPCRKFGKEEITKRNAIFVKLIRLIWNEKMFDN